MKNKSSPRLPWLKFLAIGLVVFVSAFLGFLFALGTHLALFEIFVTFLPSESFLASTNVLILGQDEAGFAKRSDTVIVARIQSADKTVQLVSIPRDTRVEIPGYGLDKINHAYAFGGAGLARRTVEEWLKVPVPYYVVVDLKGLADFVDQIGGINLLVEKKMRYVDYAGELFIDLPEGQQHLNGKQAVGYLRFRTDNKGDIGRIERQQKFIRAILSQAAKTSPAQIPLSLYKLSTYFETNLATKSILGFAMVLHQAQELGRIQMTTLDGYPEMLNGIFYLRPDETKLEHIRNILSTESTHG